jgi:hypothetical protein
MSEQPTPLRIDLDNLMVDTENPRLEEAGRDERAAIMGIVAEQRGKLVELAQDIVQRSSLSPFELALVYPVENGKYVAAEGNRRVAALKILRDPSVIDGAEPSLVRKFKSLAAKATQLPKTVLCAVVQSEAERNHWIRLRHTGENSGRGIVGWGTKEKTRYAARHSADRANRMEFALKILELIQARGNLSAEELAALRSVPITTVERMVGDPEVRAAVGIERSTEGVILLINDEKAVINALKTLVLEIARKDVQVGQMMSKEDRRGLVAKWSEDRKPGRTGEPTIPKLLTREGASVAHSRLDVSTGAGGTPHKAFRPRSPDDRKVLIPPATRLGISNLRIKRVFIELKKLEVEEYENAVAVLLRVFLELSVEDFLKRKQVIFYDTEKLTAKMEKTAKYWESAKVPRNEIRAWRNAASSHHLFSLNVLHGYVHSHLSIPKKRDLVRTWDEMESFFKRLWEQP